LFRDLFYFLSTADLSHDINPLELKSASMLCIMNVFIGHSL